MSSIEEDIDKKIGEVRIEALDMSFGEIVNLHNNKELIIQPEYQRLFRWSNDQRSRLIESILLELPIPQIFVIENSDGVLELIDGLQRVSSVIQFMNPKVLTLEPLSLQGCDLISGLNGKTFEQLSMKLRLRIKRSSMRTIVIKRQSKSFLRYEMFKRLNTGGAILSPQEIRNCSARMLGDDGTKFYTFLQDCASFDNFKNCTETLAQSDQEQKGNEELVLRFFATKNGQNIFRGSVRDWLDEYMESILLKKVNFDYPTEKQHFQKLFTFLNEVLGTGSFVRYKGRKPIGGLAPAYFEAITMGTFYIMDKIKKYPALEIKKKIIDAVQSSKFRDNTGPGANSKEKLKNRINIIQESLLSITK